jgi:hypothetical protein
MTSLPESATLINHRARRNDLDRKKNHFFCIVLPKNERNKKIVAFEVIKVERATATLVHKSGVNNGISIAAAVIHVL